MLIIKYYVSGKCQNLPTMYNIAVLGYIDRAVRGTNLTFHCPPGLVLTGSNTSTCASNGEWEPDPQHVG